MNEIRETEEGAFEIKHPVTKRWSKVVVLDGQVFPSMTEAGAILDMTAGAISSAIAQERQLAGMDVRLATKKEAESLVVTPPKKVTKQAPKKKESNGKIFEGVKWDNGGATVRLGEWSMTRGRICDIPQEIRDFTRWKS